MIFSNLPVRRWDGWGICGKNLLRELARYDEVRFLFGYPSDMLADLGNPVEQDFFIRRLATADDLQRYQQAGDHVSLQPIDEFSRIIGLASGGKNNVGVAFNLCVDEACADRLKRYFHVIAAGSRWCADLFRAQGIRAAAVPQGVDQALFHCGLQHKQALQDKFVIFSGAKFEFRKGQDLVITAVKRLQERHPDVVLITHWYGHLDYAFNSMASSPYLKFPSGLAASQSYEDRMQALLQLNGVDLTRVQVLAALDHALMAQVFRDSDVGVFPTRCEGGTNLVLMEYMACGKPAVASFHSGHLDILTKDNCLPLEAYEVRRRGPQHPPAMRTWFEPNVDEIVEKLEWAYQHRAALREIGTRGAAAVAPHTWPKMAERVYALIRGDYSAADPAAGGM